MPKSIKLIPRIVATEKFQAEDRDGTVRNVKIEICPRILPDVYIYFDGKMNLKELPTLCLYDDHTFIRNIFKFFEQEGYTGPGFGRAETGMQGNTLANGGQNYIVLEPHKEFTKFAKEKYGFKP